MERLGFASVMAVLRRNIPDENFGNQTDFLYSLFLDVNLQPQSAIEFDQGQVCWWINGLARLSPNIISFYRDSFNQRKLVSRIKNMLLPMTPDSAMAAQTLPVIPWAGAGIGATPCPAGGSQQGVSAWHSRYWQK